MKKATVQTRSLTQHVIRAAVITSVSLAMFLFAACEMNTPSGKSESNTLTGPQGKNARLMKAASVSTLVVPLGSASNFAVLGATTVTNGVTSPSLITGDLGVSPGTAITYFALTNTIVYGPGGTVTAGLGIVNGTIYAGGPVAAQAHNDAVTAYNYLVAQVPDTTYSGVTQLDGLTFTPGVYRFASSANLQVNGTVYLDFQGNSDAIFIFQMGSTLVTMAGSNVIAINTNSPTCIGSNVYWAVGSSATIDGAQFVGTVIANTAITMTSGANVSGKLLALTASVTMVTDTIATCGSSGGGTVLPPKPPCRDFVTGGGWIDVKSNAPGHYKGYEDKATFGVSGGIKNGEFWGHLSYDDHDGNTKIKSTEVTGYFVINATTREIDGVAKINNKGSFTYKVVVVDNDKDGRYMNGHNKDSFSLDVSNGYSVSGTLSGGSINIHSACGVDKGPCYNNDKENCFDNDERGGDYNCDNDRDWN